MVDKKPRKTMEFGKHDEDFIKQLARDIGCHYFKANERTYNLNKFDSPVQGEMGVFAWVHKEEDNFFWITTRKIWVERARANVSGGRKKPGANCFTRDIQHAEDSVCFDMKNDYLKTVKVLNLINKTH